MTQQAKAGDLDSVPESGRSPGEGNGDPLHFPSILAWKIVWTEKPGRLQSTESQRVRQDLATKQQTTATMS